jgi:hypothetical protein
MGWERQPVGASAAIINYYGLNSDETIYVVISMGKQDAPPPELAYVLMLNLFHKFIPTSILDNVGENEKSVRSAYEREISLGGYPGRANTLQAHKRSGLSNFYVTGKNYYLAGALTSGNNAAPVKKFLDSFALTPPPAQTAARAAAAPPAVAAGGRERVPTGPAAGGEGTWLVVLKTYPKAKRAEAEQKRAAVRRLGHEARVVESDNYPNLRKGYLVLVTGPYTKGGAELVLPKVRRVASDAYIKSGW